MLIGTHGFSFNFFFFFISIIVHELIVAIIAFLFLYFLLFLRVSSNGFYHLASWFWPFPSPPHASSSLVNYVFLVVLKATSSRVSLYHGAYVNSHRICTVHETNLKRS